MPYAQFLELVDKVIDSGMFEAHLGKDAVGKPSASIQLLILCCLRYLGRGLTFCDLEEMTVISQETIRRFFHKFIEFGSTQLFDEYVQFPTDAASATSHAAEFHSAGMHGAVASTDATNVILWHCYHNLSIHNQGYKQNHPARSYNVSCNHRRRILYTTRGHPARWNDKTVIRFDEFVTGIHDSKLLCFMMCFLLTHSF